MSATRISSCQVFLQANTNRFKSLSHFFLKRSHAFQSTHHPASQFIQVMIQLPMAKYVLNQRIFFDGLQIRTFRKCLNSFDKFSPASIETRFVRDTNDSFLIFFCLIALHGVNIATAVRQRLSMGNIPDASTVSNHSINLTQSLGTHYKPP